MPYKSLSEIPNGLKNIKPPVSLEQANEIAAQADAIGAGKEGTNGWAISIANFQKKYVKGPTGWTLPKEKAEEAEAVTDSTDSPVQEAATYKAAAMRLARDMQTLLADRTVPEALRKEIDDVRAMLRRTWSDLETEASGAMEEPEEEPAEESDSHLNANLLERTYLTLESGARVKLADCVAAYEQSLVEVEKPTEEPTEAERAALVEPTEAERAALVERWTAELKAAVAEVESWLSKPVAESDAPVESDPTAEPSAVEIVYAEQNTEEVRLTESALTEEPSGHVIELAEAQLGAWDGQGPLKLKTVLIEAGPGNKRDRHYYPADMLRRAAPLFEGRKMYASDHKQEEKSVRTEVADILRCPAGYTASGGIVAEVGIFDPDFARKVYNRAQLGTLGNLAVSIVGAGKTRRGTVDGQDYDIVQEITDGAADFVTAAGAGGRALAISETATPDTRKENKMLSQEQLAEVLAGLTAPDSVKARLAERRYETAEAVSVALDAELSYIAEVAGAGKPTGLGESAQPTAPKARRSQAEHDAAVQQIITRLGIGR